MEDVSGDTTRSRSEQDRAISSELGKRVQTMPTLPKPPTFRGSTALEKQRFMKDYEAYCRQLSALETAFFRPYRMPVGACVEDERRRLIAMFDICKLLDDITEKDWIDYFWEGRIVGELDFDKVKALMKEKLRMDVSLTDADSRVSKLAHEMYQVLEQANMEWMVKGEPKKIVNYLIDTLSPEEFRRTIKNEMAREANKPLYKDVVAFIKWFRARCKEYLRWEPANAKKPQPAPSGGKHGDTLPIVLRTAPKRTPEKVRLFFANGVMIEDVLELDRVLLDSGADVIVASRSLVAHLERNGVSVRVETCSPRSLSMFDGKTLTVMQKAWFDTIKIYTSAGPLLLRRTPAWIFGDDAEPLTMMLSRPVMERLGYSVDAILAKAYGTRPEWDLQDLATEEGAVKALQDDSRGQQGIDERLRTATPESGPLEADEMVTRLLEERVQEAADAGLAEPLVSQLRELLVEYRDVFRVRRQALIFCIAPK
ncbi:DEAD-box ATP-dependent RNA helicase 36 [Phytophthora cinnamomi]|uniref:DEAD-box ATP-dependent RNA helicase 36 n=1 Tax=Phytophthora cinnamomi TaxID=4785 RepID=UPI00355A2346|nr:DEAD-box ATP-dependent RNA helicase 36 [Phytophthora cinnamomi]